MEEVPEKKERVYGALMDLENVDDKIDRRVPWEVWASLVYKDGRTAECCSELL